MKFLPVKYQIAFGLTTIVTTTMFVVIAVGVGPDARQATLLGRKRLCESIAVNSSILLSQNDLVRMEGILRAMVQRDDDLLSAALRKAGGQSYVQIGDHDANWLAGSGYSTETQVQVPLWSGETKWGTMELCFRPITASGLKAFFVNPWTRLVGLVATITFVLFSIYLKFTLRQLDPQRAIPKRVQFALDNLAEGLLVTDRRGRVLLANEAFAAWAGKRPEQLIGIEATKFPWHEPNSQQPCHSFPWQLAMENEAVQANMLMALTDHEHSQLTLVANASPLLGSDGRYRGVMTSFEDVTALEHHKVALSKAKDVADQANQAKSEFLARMSHEIRTPMNAILGYTDVLRRGIFANDRERDEHLAVIHNSGEHLLALINDILDLSKIEAGRLELELIRTSPVTVISQVISVLKINAEQKQIALRAEFATKLPETILTDATRLRQAIINLVGNAIKFTEQGEVRIVPRLVASDRTLLAIDVIDTGIGITAEALPNIFEPFAQADTSITRRFGGTGLGLSISRQLARKLGGDMHVESKWGVGSRFTITIDPGLLDDVRLIDGTELAGQQGLEQSQPDAAEQVALPPARILVVDDGASNRRLVTLFLQRAGCEVCEAGNGQEAIDRAQETPMDVILMDMQMPVMDGFTASKRLRELGHTTPIIALTANIMKDDERKCRAAGCSGFLAKPITMDRLLHALQEILVDPADSSPTSGLTVVPTVEVAPAAGADGEADGNANTDSTDDQEHGHAAHAGFEGVGHELPDEGSVVSSLPMDDPEFREIVEEFVGRLKQQVTTMRQAADEDDLKELADLAHWLKGAGGTVGFDLYTAPAAALQASAESGDIPGLQTHLSAVEEITHRIHIPAEISVERAV